MPHQHARYSEWSRTFAPMPATHLYCTRHQYPTFVDLLDSYQSARDYADKARRSSKGMDWFANSNSRSATRSVCALRYRMPSHLDQCTFSQSTRANTHRQVSWNASLRFTKRVIFSKISNVLPYTYIAYSNSYFQLTAPSLIRPDSYLSVI
jgi:hypothetical protein